MAVTERDCSALLLLRPISRGAEYCDNRDCLSVCPSVRGENPVTPRVSWEDATSALGQSGYGTWLRAVEQRCERTVQSA